MTLPWSVGEVLRDHLTLENESIDRMYLNVYVPGLQHVGGVVWYLRVGCRGRTSCPPRRIPQLLTAPITTIEDR